MYNWETARFFFPREGEMYMFHITERISLPSILAYGVNPSFARTRQRMTWWVEAGGLGRAIVYVALRHNVLVDELAAVVASIPTEARRQAGWAWRVETVVWPCALFQAVMVWGGRAYLIDQIC